MTEFYEEVEEWLKIKAYFKGDFPLLRHMLFTLFKYQHGRPPKKEFETEKVSLPEGFKSMAKALLADEGERPCRYQTGFILLYLSKVFKDTPDISL